MVFAIKAVYNRSTRSYGVEYFADVREMASYAMQGYILVDEVNRERVADEIENGTSRMTFKKPEQAQAVVEFLRTISFIPKELPEGCLAIS